MKRYVVPAFAVMALAAGVFAGVAQAKHTPAHHPHKAHQIVPQTNEKSGYKVSGRSECPRTVIVGSGGPRQMQLYCPVR